MIFQEIFMTPFDYGFMKKALVGCLCLALGSGPVGLFLILRRMSLMGDALSHSVLPGAAVGYVLAGLSLLPMAIGGVLSGLLVAILAGMVSRYTFMKEEASFAGFFLISVALGVLIIATRSNSIDIMHILFGSALAINKASLLVIGVVSSITLLALAILYRPLIIECFDPDYFRMIGGKGARNHLIFLFLVVLNLVSGFQAMGTLLSLALMLLPALAARFWFQRLFPIILLTVIIAALSGYFGLVLSFHFNLPSGPAIVLIAGVVYLFSLLVGVRGSVFRNYRERL
jgi:zinc/manganese transport system permease protein